MHSIFHDVIATYTHELTISERNQNLNTKHFEGI